jgi:hypothetical protein
MSGKPFNAVVGSSIALLLVTGLWLVYSRTRGTSRSNGVVPDKDRAWRNGFKSHCDLKFPWEPAETLDGAVVKSTLSTTQDAISTQEYHEPILKKELSNQKELEFLANMTFANGGIRSPNCLCCR